MDEKFSPQESFELIREVISQARLRFERNGWLMIFWGIVITILSLVQYFMLKQGITKYYLVNYGYVLAAIATVIYMSFYYKKHPMPNNILSRMVSWFWLVINIHIFVLAFVFHAQLGFTLIFVLLLLISLGYIASALLLQSKILLIGALAMNVLSYVSFYISNMEQTLLLMAFIGFVCILIPGVWFQLKVQKNE